MYLVHCCRPLERQDPSRSQVPGSFFRASELVVGAAGQVKLQSSCRVSYFPSLENLNNFAWSCRSLLSIPNENQSLVTLVDWMAWLTTGCFGSRRFHGEKVVGAVSDNEDGRLASGRSASREVVRVSPAKVRVCPLFIAINHTNVYDYKHVFGHVCNVEKIC